jgi:carbamoyltransferase
MTYVLGLATMGEAAAALLKDGEIVAMAEEERFSRVKHHIGFPTHAVRYCLDEADIEIGDIDVVTHYWKPWVLGHRVLHTLEMLAKSKDLFFARAKRGGAQVRGHYAPMFWMPYKVRHEFGPSDFKFRYVEHHVAHAASTFYCSPFDDAAVLTYDGTGESTTVLFAHGQGSRLKPVKRIKLPHSLGQFYSAATNFVGFDMFAGDEYKVMGMAGWGEPRFADALAREAVRKTDDGGFELDVTFLDHHLAKHRIYSDRAVRLLGPARAPDGEVDQRHYDIAASVQKVFEETLFHMLRWLGAKTGSRNLCLAGGCALNSMANGKMLSNTPFDRLFIQPSSHDAGGALGSAQYIWHHKQGNPRRAAMRHSYWGPSFSSQECQLAADQRGLTVRRCASTDELTTDVARRISEGEIIAWFRGRMEWGPRALGHRSFLADPRRADMKEVINRKIKLREPFRPFAPSMLAEASERYFGKRQESPFMVTVYPVEPARRGEIPAVVHVDGTARPQLVEKDVEPVYWGLIKKFEERTGIPVVLNTSFNVQEPIVCTPHDAVDCFLRTDVDTLVMEDLIVTRS